jgi:hypothetical protein
VPLSLIGEVPSPGFGAGDDLISPCMCKGTQQFVHRSCLDHWRSIRVMPAYLPFFLHLCQIRSIRCFLVSILTLLSF